MKMDETMTSQNAKPPIILSAGDYERLSALTRLASNRMPSLAEELSEEIERARVLARGRHPQSNVSMNSQVKFRDDTTGKIQCVTLVYPEEVDLSQRKISVLTPVGTALIGLGVDNSISWKTPSGETRKLTVLSVGTPRLNL
jgi:regulator of nucleoside diphosphate kinase